GFTAGKEKYRDVQDEIADAMAQLAELREQFLDLAHRDMAAFDALMAAYRLPKATDDEKAARAAAVARGTRGSLDVVEAVLDAARRTLDVCRRLADIANRHLISDVGVAAELALGVALAARINVAVNLAGYADAADAAAVRKRTAEAVAEAEHLARETREAVLEIIAA
ncbi:MAG: cyclodeaminase/cyclohydrolase family protein, partial [Planctomycetes bacterium]|nr:cyclodeaminase/cyclohydrolase family protein [Planctomycetota bacterium]